MIAKQNLNQNGAKTKLGKPRGKKGEREKSDLGENDIEKSWGADVTVEDLKNNASSEDALCEVVSGGGAARGR